MNNTDYDVIIIGAGVIGCAIARELSKYELNILILEKESDVCEGTSKANSAIIHAGFDAFPCTLKARLNVAGNSMMDQLASELDFPFIRNGALVVCWDDSELSELTELYNRGISNGVKGLRMLDKNEVHRIEPNIQNKICRALYAPTSGIVCPFNMTIALAENAVQNGAKFLLSTEVKGISKEKNVFHVKTTRGMFNSRLIVNCSGVHADQIHDMICDHCFDIIARKGEYLLLDKNAGHHVTNTIFQLPTNMGKGVLVSPTVHGNLLVGPTATDIDDKEDTSTSANKLRELKEVALYSVKDIPYNQVITSFSGLRATTENGDFIITEDHRVKGFIDVAGVDSPGLSSAPAIAVYVRDLVDNTFPLNEKNDFVNIRTGIHKTAEMSYEERKKLISKRSDYGNIVCRCEQISEGEIVDAIHSTLGATTLDGVKRRVRAGMGRCQGGFCLPRLLEIMNRELGIDYKDVKKNG